MSDQMRFTNFLNLTAGLAHQLNNDLAAVVGYAEIIADDAAADDPISGYATEILMAGRSVRATVERFHTLHRMARADLGSFDIRHSLEHACNRIIARSGEAVAVSLDVPPTSVMVGGHAQEVLPVLRELADVATSVIGGAGAITMTVQSVEILTSKELSHGTVSQGEYAGITLLATATGSEISANSMGRFVPEQVPTSASINAELLMARSAVYLLGGAIHIWGAQNSHCGVQIYLPLTHQTQSTEGGAKR